MRKPNPVVSPSPWATVGLILAGCGSGEPEPHLSRTLHELARTDPQAAANLEGAYGIGSAGDQDPAMMGDPGTFVAPASVVYEVAQRSRGGLTLSVEERGQLGEPVLDRLARPEIALAEGLIYEQKIWLKSDAADQETLRGMVVTRRAAPALGAHAPVVRPKLAPELVQAIARATPGSALHVMVKLSNTEDGPLPRVPKPGTVSEADYLAAAQQRQQEYRRREAAFGTRADTLRAGTNRLGGVVRGAFPKSGWLALTLPASSVRSLAELPEVARIVPDFELEPHTGPSLGELRTAAFTNLNALRDAGYTGENGSNAQLRVAVVETTPLEDEVCYLDDEGAPNGDVCDPSERLKLKMNCDSASCTETSNYPASEESFHGTVVTSIIAADYTQGQADGVNVGDNLPAGWQEDATGFAKEADIHYYRFSDGSSGHKRAAECAQGIGTSCSEVDVLNSSNGWNGGAGCPSCCDPSSSSSLEDELEDLYDDGVLPVISAGNSGSLVSLASCSVNSPADTSKVFAVGGLEASTTAAYHTWGRMSEGSIVSSRGGADIEVGGIVREGTLSLVDLAASGKDIEFVTRRDDGDNGNGTVKPTYGGDGTSFSAPQVAGAAVALKDWLLDSGNAWINNPGWLHVLLLAMGDRGTLGASWATAPQCVSGDQIMCGADTLFGFGRLKLRLFQNGQGLGPWALSMWQHTLTEDTPTIKLLVDENPVPNGAELVKCVLQQREDFSTKDDMSLIRLRVEVRTPVNGACSIDGGSVASTRFDALFDDKHLVAFEDAQHNIEDRCIQVELDPIYLSSAGSVTVQTVCYYAGELDDV